MRILPYYLILKSQDSDPLFVQESFSDFILYVSHWCFMHGTIQLYSQS